MWYRPEGPNFFSEDFEGAKRDIDCKCCYNKNLDAYIMYISDDNMIFLLKIAGEMSLLPMGRPACWVYCAPKLGSTDQK